MKLDHLLILHTRINSKWIKDLNVRPKAIKMIEENIGTIILNIAHSNILSVVSAVNGNKRKNKQIGLHQTGKFFHSKGNHQQNKRTILRMGEYVTNTSDKGLISKLYKVLTNLNTKRNPKQTSQLKNQQRT